MVVTVQDYLVILPNHIQASILFGIVNTIAVLFVYTVLVFLIFYFWGARRILQHLRARFPRISVLLFVGSAIGSASTGLVVLFVCEARAGNSVFALSGLIPYSIIQAVSFPS